MDASYMRVVTTGYAIVATVAFVFAAYALRAEFRGLSGDAPWDDLPAPNALVVFILLCSVLFGFAWPVGIPTLWFVTRGFRHGFSRS